MDDKIFLFNLHLTGKIGVNLVVLVECAAPPAVRLRGPIANPLPCC